MVTVRDGLWFQIIPLMILIIFDMLEAYDCRSWGKCRNVAMNVVELARDVRKWTFYIELYREKNWWCDTYMSKN